MMKTNHFTKRSTKRYIMHYSKWLLESGNGKYCWRRYRKSLDFYNPNKCLRVSL